MKSLVLKLVGSREDIEEFTERVGELYDVVQIGPVKENDATSGYHRFLTIIEKVKD